MADQSHPHLCVLVVEDEPLIRWSIAETLAQQGHHVVEAGNADAAVQALNDTPGAIDVVLLDYRLPDSDDLGLLRNIRHLRPESAVVMMTAFADDGMKLAARERGALAVIDKPFQIRTIVDLVESAVVA